MDQHGSTWINRLQPALQPAMAHASCPRIESVQRLMRPMSWTHASHVLDSCVMRHASCVMRHASCVMRHASCVMRHASCVMRHASGVSCVRRLMRPAPVVAYSVAHIQSPAALLSVMTTTGRRHFPVC